MPRLLLGMLVWAVASGGRGTPPAHPCETCHREIVATFRETAHFRTSADASARSVKGQFAAGRSVLRTGSPGIYFRMERSEEHTSELQSHSDLVCRLLLEKKKKKKKK